MNPGVRNKKVTIQKKQKQTPLEDTNYIDYKRVYADVINLNTKEKIEAQSINPNISKKIIIRYIKDLDPDINEYSSEDYIIKYKSLTFNILSINNIREENRYMEILLGSI